MFKTFESFDDMMAHITAGREAADQAASDYQKTAQAGDFYVRVDEMSGLIIYGELLDPIEAERAAGAEEDELAYVRRLRAQPHMANYRFGRHYSVACVDGEYGDVHVASITKVISAEEFALARAAGWPEDLDEMQTLLKVLPEDLV